MIKKFSIIKVHQNIMNLALLLIPCIIYRTKSYCNMNKYINLVII